MSTKKIRKLLPVIPQLAEYVGLDPTFVERTNDIVDNLLEENSKEKAQRRHKRLISISDIGLYTDLERIRKADSIAEKSASVVLSWLKFDYVNNMWRIHASANGIKRPIHIAIGEKINKIEHMDNATFIVETEICRLEYDDNSHFIKNYILI